LQLEKIDRVNLPFQHAPLQLLAVAALLVAKSFLVFVGHFFPGFLRAVLSAIATACFCGLPAAISVLIF
jgi:hypothetical protein